MDINNAHQLITGKLLAWLHDLIRLLPNILLVAVVLVTGFVHAALNNLFESTLFTGLSVLQLDKAVTSIWAGAGILSLALAFQDIAANFISGILISFRSPIQIGDVVKIKRHTVIRTFQGQMVIIPNKDVFQNPIENYSLLGKRRFDLSIGVSYGDDLEKSQAGINFQLRMWISSPEQITYMIMIPFPIRTLDFGIKGGVAWNEVNKPQA
ncbi:mechanosensitive ion channel [Mucilaginibacter corticis]|uniref:Mechanosensitive ion channel n=1 Tax=Mucilaginibacter corticis TaxID=2597670 RepID=A0A556MX43_9SPHI|nr:mechanosensitive ion channel domain-containing protein [Mucilaginibacter corticis]TSJ44491.1 mechanosensitive ion channel [Mucilaginibacter corticis]